ncbi:hypothetical protein LshimejAT787_0500280 [Lyophyllum shimeji]|uniref:Uncharacterized protein n=1 Tax=Lyophyllum shimeji TaxID=47721 RepID=A0A9P3PMH5_LYOSH|nr:hypothetical protein LshimejAT787_0500280 [Lyophyllum shimeji]
MSIAPKALRKLRIIAIPLTRPRIRAPPNASPCSQALTYYQFQLSPPPVETPESRTPRSRWKPEGGIAKWVTTKAADVWAGFGKAPGGWKLKVFQIGERLVDRLEFEELALKSIDPSLGPSILRPGAVGKRNGGVDDVDQKIPLIYPPSITSDSKGFLHVDDSRTIYGPIYHYSDNPQSSVFLLCMAIMVALQSIQSISVPPGPARRRRHRSEASEALDGVYRQFAPRVPEMEATTKPESTPSFSPTTPPQHEILLTRDAVPAILNIFGLDSTAGADLLRAVEQARVRVQSGRTAL